MGRPKRWNLDNTGDGVWLCELSSWRYFFDFVYQAMLNARWFVWRGQQRSSWLLESTLARHLRQHPADERRSIQSRHLSDFKYAVRGRRGNNPRSLIRENEWWALGQHYGLHTPLLDWATSPFVAAHFAYFDAAAEQTEPRAVFALNRSFVEKRSNEISKEGTKAERPPTVEFFQPMSDENPRLVSQSGLFTRGPDAGDIESWVRANFPGEKHAVLLKFTLPNKDRDFSLRSLNRMNINHLSLFPDLLGACGHCNLSLEIGRY